MASFLHLIWLFRRRQNYTITRKKLLTQRNLQTFSVWYVNFVNKIVKSQGASYVTLRKQLNGMKWNWISSQAVEKWQTLHFFLEFVRPLI